MRARRAASTLIASIACLLACVAAHAVEPVPLAPPPSSALPSGPLGDAIRYGQALITNTRALASGSHCLALDRRADRCRSARSRVQGICRAFATEFGAR